MNSLPGLTIQQQYDLILSVGTRKRERRLSPVEVGKLFQQAMCNGASLKECAKFVHLSGTSMISRFMQLERLPKSVIHFVDWGGRDSALAFSVASELVKLEDELLIERLAFAILEYSLSKTDVIQVIQIIRRSDKSLDDAINEVLAQRPIVEEIHLIMGLISGHDVHTRLSKLSQLQRNDLLQGIVNRIGVPDVLKAVIGNGRFTLLVKDSCSCDWDKVESEVNFELRTILDDM